ncbi:unnamed protein product [Alternaria alternata]
MPRYAVSDDDEPLEDKTAALTLKNKKTERMKRKNATRQQKRDAIVNITKLPTELILESLKYLRPLRRLVLDFAHWQDYLDSGTPLPIIPRGQIPEWNKELVARHGRIARKAIENSLWHAVILQRHLDSTVRAIWRHSKNRGNKRVHVDMTAAEAAEETDAFLAKHGPPSLEFPYQRDEYYMLEAYLPNRWWRKQDAYWFYTIGGQHERDLELVQRFAKR